MSRRNLTETISAKGGLAAALRQANEKLAEERERKGKAPASAESSRKSRPQEAPAEKLMLGGMKDPKADLKRKNSEQGSQAAKRKKDDNPADAPKSDRAASTPSGQAGLTSLQRKAMAKGILAVPDVEEASEQLLKGPGDLYVSLVSAIAEMVATAKAFGKKKVSWERKERELDNMAKDRAKELQQARANEDRLEKAARAERADFKAEIDRLKRGQKESKAKEDRLEAENALLKAEAAELKLRPASKEEVVEEFLLSDQYAHTLDEEAGNTFFKVCRRFMRCLDKMKASVNLQELDLMIGVEPDSEDEAAAPENKPGALVRPVAEGAVDSVPAGVGLQLIPFQAASPIFIPSSPFGGVGTEGSNVPQAETHAPPSPAKTVINSEVGAPK